jgi:1-acyl-sn-glycerol-3-phosphate acyltransferase
MSQTSWNAPPAPPPLQLRPHDWLRVARRGLALGGLIAVCLAIMMALRLIERPLWGKRRPLTPFLTQFVSLSAFRILGMGYQRRGARMQGRGAVVANHVSWLDIFALNAGKRVYFVSKAEVAGWPGIGLLARATGTVFIKRDPREAKHQQEIFEERLLAGHKLLFFPEGTSTDGMVVLPFKTTLFQAFFAPELRQRIAVQPVSLIYHAPEGADPRFYGWWGDMDFGTHLLRVLAAPQQGRVEVVYHDPLALRDFASRKDLAAQCEAAIRAAMPKGRQGGGA